MSLPRLDAAASLYRTTAAYSSGSRRNLHPASRVVPAWCSTFCKGGECFTRCCDCYMGECSCWSSQPRPI